MRKCEVGYMLLWYELKKIVFSPAMVGMVALCIVLNTVIVIASYNDYGSNYEVEAADIFEGFKTSEIAETYI
jgi:hypothetical protein